MPSISNRKETPINILNSTKVTHTSILDLQVVMSNGIVSVTLSTPSGHVTSITYNGSTNLLQTKNIENNRGYTTYFIYNISCYKNCLLIYLDQVRQ